MFVQTVDVLLLQYLRNIRLLVIYCFIITIKSLAQINRIVLNMNNADGRSLLQRKVVYCELCHMS